MEDIQNSSDISPKPQTGRITKRSSSQFLPFTQKLAQAKLQQIKSVSKLQLQQVKLIPLSGQKTPKTPRSPRQIPIDQDLQILKNFGFRPEESFSPYFSTFDDQGMYNRPKPGLADLLGLEHAKRLIQKSALRSAAKTFEKKARFFKFKNASHINFPNKPSRLDQNAILQVHITQARKNAKSQASYTRATPISSNKLFSPRISLQRKNTKVNRINSIMDKIDELHIQNKKFEAQLIPPKSKSPKIPLTKAEQRRLKKIVNNEANKDVRIRINQ